MATRYRGPAIEDRGGGSFRFEINHNGERHRISFHAEDRRAAEEAAPELERQKMNELSQPEAKGATSLTVHVALDTFLNEKYDPALNPIGHSKHKSQVNGVKRYFAADTLLIDIGTVELTKLILRRQKETVSRRNDDGDMADQPISNATINRTLIETLSRTFTYFEDAYGYRFPNKPVFKKHKLEETGIIERYLSDAEYETLTNVGRDDFLAVVNFDLLTGFRMKNTLLRWKEVKMTRGADGALFGVAKVSIKSKGHKKRQMEFDLPEAACEIIAAQKHPDGSPFNEEFVFTYVAERTRDGRVAGGRYPITVSGLQSWWKRHRKATGIKHFRFHDLRHTAASAILEATGDITIVQRQLGHSDLATTQRYAHAKREKVSAGVNAAASASPWGRKVAPLTLTNVVVLHQSPQNPPQGLVIDTVVSEKSEELRRSA